MKREQVAGMQVFAALFAVFLTVNMAAYMYGMKEGKRRASVTPSAPTCVTVEPMSAQEEKQVMEEFYSSLPEDNPQ